MKPPQQGVHTPACKLDLPVVWLSRKKVPQASSKVNEKYLSRMRFHSQTRPGSTFAIKHATRQEWHRVPEQTIDSVFLKIYDHQFQLKIITVGVILCQESRRAGPMPRLGSHQKQPGDDVSDLAAGPNNLMRSKEGDIMSDEEMALTTSDKNSS